MPFFSRSSGGFWQKFLGGSIELIFTRLGPIFDFLPAPDYWGGDWWRENITHIHVSSLANFEQMIARMLNDFKLLYIILRSINSWPISTTLSLTIRTKKDFGICQPAGWQVKVTHACMSWGGGHLMQLSICEVPWIKHMTLCVLGGVIRVAGCIFMYFHVVFSY